MNGGGSFDWPTLIYLLMALLLVTGAGWGFRRIRHDKRSAIIGILFWPALILVIVLVYNALN